jgi:hypothetical protein
VPGGSQRARLFHRDQTSTEREHDVGRRIRCEHGSEGLPVEQGDGRDGRAGTSKRHASKMILQKAIESVRSDPLAKHTPCCTQTAGHAETLACFGAGDAHAGMAMTTAVEGGSRERWLVSPSRWTTA